MVSGAWLYRRPTPFQKGVGVHFFGWGFIDAIIALFGLFNNRRNEQSEQASDPEFVANEARKLSLALWVNGGLDIFYVLGGLWLYRKKGEDDAKWRGQGIGVIIQGGFLLIFDVWHALKLDKRSIE